MVLSILLHASKIGKFFYSLKSSISPDYASVPLSVKMHDVIVRRCVNQERQTEGYLTIKGKYQHAAPEIVAVLQSHFCSSFLHGSIGFPMVVTLRCIYSCLLFTLGCFEHF